MIRHIAELAALLLCFAVGVGILVAGGIGLLLIWDPDGWYGDIKARSAEDEYRRVEYGGAHFLPVEPQEAMASLAPHPYNWATREPMVWGLGEPIDDSAEFNALLSQVRRYV